MIFVIDLPFTLWDSKLFLKFYSQFI